MGANTMIAWTDHTFNPWHGCVRVSPGCQNCYAETFDRRTFGTSKHVTAKGETREPHWGKDAPRRFFGDAHWREPLKWNAEAAKAGVRKRVFCASMADVFEDRRDLDEPRERLWDLIHRTTNLDWLLLTKRPENALRLSPWFDGRSGCEWPRNIWLGTTCEDQQRADERIPHLLAVPATVRFLSVEPMLGPVTFPGDWWCGRCENRLSSSRVTFEESCDTCNGQARWASVLGEQPEGDRGIDWVIVGGESGHGARPFDVAWARSIVRQTREAGVACFVKQLGANVEDRNDAGFDGSSPHAWPVEVEEAGRVEHLEEGYQGAPVRIRIEDPKGGELEEWPEDLRVREFPR